LPLSLDKIAETFCDNFKKLKTDFITETKDLYDIAKMMKIEEHCRRDCDVLQEGILKYEEYCFSNFKIDPLYYLSLPSISLALFRTYYYDKDNKPIGKLSKKKRYIYKKRILRWHSRCL